MKPKQLIILAALLAVAIIVAAMLKGDGGGKEHEGPAAGDLVLPDLPVNDIAKLRITSGEKSVELARSGETWGVADRGGYAADFTKLSKVLKNLRDLKVADSIRAGESAYGRLEIKDPGSVKDDKAGTLVELKKGDDSMVASLVLGKNYSGASDGSGNAGGGSGRYVRADSDKEHVYIVSESFYEVNPDPSNWLKRDFFRVEKHKSITITHPEGEVYKFSRAEENGTMTMEGLADNEELNTTNTGTISSAFSSASFRDVAVGDAAKPENTGLDKPVKVEIETFPGLRYVVNLGQKAEDNTASTEASATLNDAKFFLTVEVSGELPEKREPQDDESVADDASDEDKQKAEDLKTQRDEEFESAQQALKEKLEKEKAFAGHVYEVDRWAAEKFFKKRDELVKMKEPEPEPPTPAPDPAPTPPGDALNLIPKEILNPPPGASVTPPAAPEGKITATTPPLSIADAVKGDEVKEASEESAAPADAAPEEAEKADAAAEAESQGDQLEPGTAEGEAAEGAESAEGEAAAEE